MTTGTSNHGECSTAGEGFSVSPTEVKISFYSHNTDSKSSTTRSHDHVSINVHFEQPKGSQIKTESSNAASEDPDKNSAGRRQTLPAYVPSSTGYLNASKGPSVDAVEAQYDSPCDDEAELIDLTEEEKQIVFTGISRSVKSAKSTCKAILKSSASDSKNTEKSSGISSLSTTTSAISSTTQDFVENKNASGEKDVGSLGEGQKSKSVVNDVFIDDIKKEKLESGEEQERVLKEKASNKVEGKLWTKEQTPPQKPKSDGGEKLGGRILQDSAGKIKRKRKSSGSADSSKPIKVRKLDPNKKDEFSKRTKGQKEVVKASSFAASRAECKPEGKKQITKLTDVDFFTLAGQPKKTKLSEKLKCKEKSPNKKVKSKTTGRSAVSSTEKKTVVKAEGSDRRKEHPEEFFDFEDIPDFPEITTCSPKPKKFEKRKIFELEESGCSDVEIINVAESPLFSDSSSEDDITTDSQGDSELRKIFNEYQPHQEQQLKQRASHPNSKITATNTRRSNPVTPEKPPSMADKLGLGKKQRVAHESSYVSVANFLCYFFFGGGRDLKKSYS